MAERKTRHISNKGYPPPATHSVPSCLPVHELSCSAVGFLSLDTENQTFGVNHPQSVPGEQFHSIVSASVLKEDSRMPLRCQCCPDGRAHSSWAARSGVRLGKTPWASRNIPVPVAGSRAREQDDARDADPAGLGGGLDGHTPLPRLGGVLVSRGCPHPTGRFAER